MKCVGFTVLLVNQSSKQIICEHFQHKTSSLIASIVFICCKPLKMIINNRYINDRIEVNAEININVITSPKTSALLSLDKPIAYDSTNIKSIHMLFLQFFPQFQD